MSCRSTICTVTRGHPAQAAAPRPEENVRRRPPVGEPRGGAPRATARHDRLLAHDALIRVRSRREARRVDRPLAAGPVFLARGCARSPTHAAMRNRIVSATRPGPNAMAQPLAPALARPHQPVEHEHHRARRHVAAVVEYAPRGGQRGPVAVRRLFHRVQHRAPAGMHRPQIEASTARPAG